MKKRFGKMLVILMVLCMFCGAVVCLSGCGSEKITVRTSPDDGPNELADTYKALYEETAAKLKQTENSLSRANAEKAKLNQELSETAKDLEEAQKELTQLKEDYKSVHDQYTGLSLDYQEYKDKMQTYETYAENNTRIISPGISASRCIGLNVQDVINKLQEAGFTNIRTVALGDLIFGFMYSDGDTAGIAIGGMDDFSAGSQFLSDSEVVVRYHTFAG